MKLNFLQRRRLNASMGNKAVEALQGNTEVVEKEEPAQESNIIGAMNLYLLKDGSVKSNCQWAPTIEGSKAFGEFLFCLHSGKIRFHNIGMLTDLAVQDVTARTLVNAVLERWQELIIAEEDRPVILPHEALRMGHDTEEE